MTLSIDAGLDLHTHSDLTDGADSPEAMADAAVRAGLHTWGLSDHVRATSDWVDGYVTRVRGLRRPGLTIRCGVEAKVLDTRGALDLPAGLAGLDYLLVADHQFPGETGPLGPRVVAGQLTDGTRRASDVVDDLVTAMSAALRRSPFRPILVHPFSLLPKMGLTEDLVGADHLHAIADACLSSDGAVEINEKWSCPSPRIAVTLSGMGVPLVAGSDAHRCADGGAHNYATQLITDASTTRSRTSVAP